MFRPPPTEEQNSFIQIINTLSGFRLLKSTRFDEDLARKSGYYRIKGDFEQINESNQRKLNELVNSNLNLEEELDFLTTQQIKLRKGIYYV